MKFYFNFNSTGYVGIPLSGELTSYLPTYNPNYNYENTYINQIPASGNSIKALSFITSESIVLEPGSGYWRLQWDSWSSSSEDIYGKIFLRTSGTDNLITTSTVVAAPSSMGAVSGFFTIPSGLTIIYPNQLNFEIHISGNGLSYTNGINIGKTSVYPFWLELNGSLYTVFNMSGNFTNGKQICFLDEYNGREINILSSGNGRQVCFSESL